MLLVKLLNPLLSPYLLVNSRVDYPSLFKQEVLKKENSKFKQAQLRLKITLCQLLPVWDGFGEYVPAVKYQ